MIARSEVDRLGFEAWAETERDASDAEVERLKAEVERLRKAGDWMCGLLQFDFVTKEWNAAKEGKQS